MNGLFGLNGLSGLLIAVVLLLSVVGALGYLAVVTQSAEALNPYKIEKASTIPMQGASMDTHFKDAQTAK